MGEVIFHVVMLVIMGLFFKESLLITSGRTADPIGPAGFPQGIIIIITVLLIISLFNAVKRLKTIDDKKEALKLTPTYFGILFSIVIFIILNEVISFTLASVVFCFALFFLLGQKKYLKMLINSIIVAAIFTFVFGNILTVPLPRGIGVIRELSFYLY